MRRRGIRAFSTFWRAPYDFKAMLIEDLQTDMLRLRARWPQEWPGMTWVLTECLQRLAHPEPASGASTPLGATRRYRDLRASAYAMADAVETFHAAMAEKACEARYHNRLHFADCMFSLCALLKAAQGDSLPSCERSGEQEMLMLLVMLAHDFEHDGRVNRAPMEMEKLSADAALRLLQGRGLDDQDLAILARIIRHTDPAMVPANHREVLGRGFSLDDPHWLQVLANEADILASSLPQFGPSLAEALAQEWRDAHPAMAEGVVSDRGRLYFLEQVALFSSPASHALGLASVRQQQIDAIRASLGAL